MPLGLVAKFGLNSHSTRNCRVAVGGGGGVGEAPVLPGREVTQGRTQLPPPAAAAGAGADVDDNVDSRV